MIKNGVSIKLINIKNTITQFYSGIRCLFVISGGLDVLVDGERHLLKADDIIIINSSQVNVLSGKPSALVLSLWIPNEYLESECPDLLHLKINCNSSDLTLTDKKKYYELKRFFIMMKITESEKKFGYQLQMNILLLRFLQILLLQFTDKHAALIENTPQNKNDALIDILKYLETSYSQNISVQDMANRLYMSPNYFSKYFKRHTGVSFHEYLKKIRLEHAVQELLFTNIPISTIALKNGFPNFQSFSSSFKKIYGLTPATYRKKNTEMLDIFPEKNIIDDSSDPVNAVEFLRHIRRYNVNSVFGDSEFKTLKLNVSTKEVSSFQPPEHLLNINTFDMALRTLFTESASEIKKLNIKYTYLCFPLEKFDLTYNQNPLFSELAQSIEKIYQHNFVPFFRICLHENHFEAGRLNSHVQSCFCAMLQLLKNWFSPEYIKQWKFEICLNESDFMAEIDTYALFSHNIHQTLPESEIGICGNGISLHTFEEILLRFYPSRLDFVTFGIFPNDKKKDYLPDIQYYSFEKLHRKTAEDIHFVCQRILGTDIPVFMCDWNTLTGDSAAEVEVYFRPALIFQALWETRDLINGAAFWLDTPTSYHATGEKQTISLALFLYGMSRRPVYYVLEIIQRIGNEILYENQEEHILLTRNSSGEFIVLMWNPCFLNPCYCLDDSHLEQEAKSVQIELLDIPNGKYRIKKIVLERDSSGVQAEYIRSGYPDTSDPDVHQYMLSSSAKKLTFYEEKIESGYYHISEKIGFNGIIMYIFRQLF